MTEINPKVSVENFSVLEVKTEPVQSELEIVRCDTILGLPTYHLFNNTSASLVTWLRNSAVGVVHILTLLSPVGYNVKVNTQNAMFDLNIEQPLIKLISTSNGYKMIKN